MIVPQMSMCCIKVRYLVVIAICRFTAHTTQVYIVAPKMSLPAMCPSLLNAWCSSALVHKKKIMVALQNPLNIQPSI